MIQKKMLLICMVGRMDALYEMLGFGNASTLSFFAWI
jgi:hypothetical protein